MKWQTQSFSNQLVSSRLPNQVLINLQKGQDLLSMLTVVNCGNRAGSFRFHLFEENYSLKFSVFENSFLQDQQKGSGQNQGEWIDF